MARTEHIVDEAHDGARADVFVAAAVEGVTRSQAASLIAQKRVAAAGRVLPRSAFRLRAGQTVVVDRPEPRTARAQPQEIAIRVVHEDEDLLVLDKPAGLVVHPAPGHEDGTLVNALLHHIRDLSGVGGELRPGIVHRIDKETSGLMVVSKNDAAHFALQKQFSSHSIDRAYLAICVRVSGSGLEEAGVISTTHGRHPVDRMRFTGRGAGARAAITHYRVLERFRLGAMLVECRLETGRTHQIRMHLAERGCPLLGDRLYGGEAVAATPLIGRVALHARLLGFRHPDGRWLEFGADAPPDFMSALARLREGAAWRR